MHILEYVGLDVSRVKTQYEKVRSAIERDDFRQAEVKKLAGVDHGKFYRAKLDYANRLLFTLLEHGGRTCALMLEVIEHHAYDKSRFLRGAAIDDAKIPPIDAPAAAAEAVPIRYIHPERRVIHLLDKPLSFDDAQEAVYRLPPPAIVVGSAGSGKTALTLEKLKHAEGEVLYVTHSAYLAQCARELYYGHGFERTGQEAVFLSYREFVESLRVPPGREALWRDFASWFARQQQAFRGLDTHQAFEEIRGVLTAEASAPLERAHYLALGVRQSIFAAAERGRVYDLFERYRAWLAEAGLYDINLNAHAWRSYAAPRYDFIVIDEVQDLTGAQLALVLATLKKPGQFVLCGDSNQIVHPNFFSWSKVKRLFWGENALAERQTLSVLSANFRNGREATRVANTLLKIKHCRFGSIDRESNFLVEAVGAEEGTVIVLPDNDGVIRDINQKTRQSARFAVLVMRDEDKAAARAHFQTPLIFSIHEAKGLEYENIVLYRFVSGNRARFSEIAEGVAAADLEMEALDYRRAHDKTDRSLEIYKFYVNALYVALTRAIRNVYLIESDIGHPLLNLLGLGRSGEGTAVETAASSLDEWQKEARKLELQGKQEQADAIRQTILKQVPVPWPVFDEAALREIMSRVFRDRVPGGKPRQQLYEYATCYDEPVLAKRLVDDADFAAARSFQQHRATLGRKHYVTYFAQRFRDILQQCERHGIDHRTPMNQTPLMAAAAAGNVTLVETLLERGANPESTDHLGRTALHWAMAEAFRDPAYAKGPFCALYELIAPAAVDVKADERLVRLDRHLSEYFLFQTLWTLFKSRFHGANWRDRGGIETGAILDAWKHLPRHVLPAERNKRASLSGVLARNEVKRDYAYNRRLFLRIGHGSYQFNPALAVRRRDAAGETWVPVFEALNLRFVLEGANRRLWLRIEELLEMAGLPAPAAPIGGEHIMQQLREDRAEYAAMRREAESGPGSDRGRTGVGPESAADPDRGRTEVGPGSDRGRSPTEVESRTSVAAEPSTRLPAPPQPQPAPWGTRAARRAEIERVRHQIEENAARRNSDGDDSS
ncbi:MAG: ankyrin repeat domain-containing protein [Burkholderiales bacterium]|nr:ankyrin repeat domain-containing protein [Burkholderiales bacterium]